MIPPLSAPTRRIYYGWTVAAMVFMAMGLAIGTTQYAVGVFIKPLEQEFDWSRAQINGALSLFAISALIGPFAGRMMDRFGVRRVMSLSALVMGLSFLARPLMTDLWHWYALIGVQCVAFTGISMLPAGKLIGTWFPERRGRVLGTAATGANVGGLVITPLAAFMVERAGWEGAFVLLAVLCLVAAPVMWLLVRDSPAHHGSVDREVAQRAAQAAGSGMTASAAIRTRAFWAVTFAIGAGTFTYYAVLTQVVPHLQNVGMSASRAAFVMSGVAVFAMIGKSLFGYLTERIPPRYVMMASIALQAAGLCLLVVGGQTPLIWLYMPVFGLGMGALGSVIPLLLQDTFGLKHFGSIYGLANLASAVSSFAGPLMVGVLYDATGAYTIAFLGVVVIYLTGIASLSLAKPPAWKPKDAKETVAAAQA